MPVVAFPADRQGASYSPRTNNPKPRFACFFSVLHAYGLLKTTLTRCLGGDFIRSNALICLDVALVENGLPIGGIKLECLSFICIRESHSNALSERATLSSQTIPFV